MAGCQWCGVGSACTDAGANCTACAGHRQSDVCGGDASCRWCATRSLCAGSGDTCAACAGTPRGMCTGACQWCGATLSCVDAAMASACECSALGPDRCASTAGCRSCPTLRACVAATATCPSCRTLTSATECAESNNTWCSATEVCIPGGQQCAECRDLSSHICANFTSCRLCGSACVPASQACAERSLASTNTVLAASLVSSVVACQCAALDAGERSALCALKSSLNISSTFWTTNPCTTPPESITGLTGITLSGNHVRTIILLRCGLQGTIPPEIGLFHNLVNLYLNDNNIRGTIPKTLASLRLLSEIDTCTQCSSRGTGELCRVMAGCQWCSLGSACTDAGANCTACAGHRQSDVCGGDASCRWCATRSLCAGSGDTCAACAGTPRGMCTGACQWCGATLSCVDAAMASACECSALGPDRCASTAGCRSCPTLRACVAATATCPSCRTLTSATECAESNNTWCSATEVCIPGGQQCAECRDLSSHICANFTSCRLCGSACVPASQACAERSLASTNTVLAASLVSSVVGALLAVSQLP
eukprot:m51a1_g4998 hypothetical protein (541) ;mRNA; r:213658-218728